MSEVEMQFKSASDIEKEYLARFIEAYKNSPLLWDPTHKFYTAKEKREEELGKLLLIFKHIKPNAARDDVRKKINVLRSCYRKELRKIEVAKRVGRVYKPRAWNFYAMQFLKKVEKPVIFPGDLQQEEEEVLDQEEEEEQEVDYVETSSYTSDDPPPPKIVKTSIVKAEPLQQPAEFEQSFTVLNNVNPLANNVNPLAIVWTDKLAQLNPTQRLFAEKAINDVLFEAQLNTLHRNSVQINSCQRCGEKF